MSHVLLPRKALAMMPIVAVVGAALGAAVARDNAVPVSTAIFWFAAGMCLSSWATSVLENIIAAAFGVDPESTAASAVAFLCDALLGIATGVFLAAVASVDLLEAAGAASALLFLHTLIVDKMLIGNAAGNAFMTLLHGVGGGTKPDYSRAESLAMRGDVAGARASYESAIAANARDVRAYRALAHMLRTEVKDYESAVNTLQRALDAAKPDAAIREALVREIAELYIHYLNAPGRAAVILARYIDREHGVRDVSWARSMLKTAKSSM